MERAIQFFKAVRGCWLLACLLSYESVAAQVGAPADTVDFLVELITVEDGLPQGMVQCMVQDRAGYLWFGTRGGLARSDGYGYTIYQHDDKDSTSIGSNIVRKMLEDRSGLLWLGFESGAVDRYDPRTGTFTHVVRDPLGSLGQLPEIRSLTEDRNGNIWFYAFHGGLRVVRSSDTSARPTPENARTAFPMIAWPTWMDAFGMAGNGELWIAHDDSIAILDPQVQRCVKHVRANYLSPTFEVKDLHYQFSPDQEGTGMWLTREDELYHFKSGVHGPMAVLRAPMRAVLYCSQEIQGRVWIGASLNEWILSADGLVSAVRSKEIHSRRIKLETDVICWMEDRSGNIWAGTNGYGVLKITPTRQRFHQLPDLGSVSRISASGTVAVQGAFVDQLTDSTERMVEAGVYKILHAHGLMLNPNIWARDAQGRTWVSTAPQWGMRPRLTVIDPSGAIRFPDLVPDSLATRSIYPGRGDDVWALAVSSVLGWEATVELLRIDTRTERTVRRYAFPFGERSWSDVASSEIDADGSVWLVTINGLYHLEPAAGKWEHFHHDDADPRSLPTDRLIGICFDPHDPRLLWIGSGGGGLLKFDPRSGVLERYTTKEGLPSNVVYGILPDERGNLWFSTDMGLCRFDPRTKELKRYTYEDGLMGNEFNTRATAATADGRMFFGGPMGATWFRPSEFYDTTSAAPTVIIGLRLTNRPVTVGAFTLHGEERPLRTEAIDHTRSITVPFDERMITFTFACMDHTAPKANTFRYRLQGFDKEWIEAGTTHEATFTNLDPGTYTFMVQGRNSAGVLDEQGASMLLIITPPWWGTWWFRMAVVLVFAGGLYGFYRYRLAHVLKVARMRDRIARDLHDEIGSTLSSVALFSEVAKRQDATPGVVRTEMLTRISESTSQMVESMNDIVWAVNSKNDELLQVVQRMQEFAARIAEACGFELDFSYHGIDGSRSLQMVQRKNLYLIFKEAVNNAAKYAQCSKLTIRLTNEKDELVLRVQDDGVGYDSNKTSSANGGGNGRRNMQSRAKEIDGSLHETSAPGQGTCVELRFEH